MTKTLTELRTTGFRKLRGGRIHLRCYSCGRKMSNVPRVPEHDPTNAALVETACEKCGQGCKDPEMFWYDAAGNEIDWYDSDAPLAVEARSPLGGAA